MTGSGGGTFKDIAQVVYNLHKCEVPKLPHIIMALPCEAVNLYDTILEDIWGPQKSGQGG